MTTIKLSNEQQAVYRTIEGTQQHIFVTGKAGTGKSELLNYLRNNTQKSMVVVAPTGIAALNIRGQTIHSLFQIPPSIAQKDVLKENPKLSSLLKKIKLIIIDEVSMVRADLLEAINWRMQQACGNDLSFGGAQIVMFGDLYQLPPIVDEDLQQYFELVYGGPHFFNASVWEKTDFKIYELTEIFRQKDQAFKEILNAVRDGTVTSQQLDSLNERVDVKIPKKGVITLGSTNALVSEINQSKLRKIRKPLFKYVATIAGRLEKPAYPADEILTLKVGAQIMMVKNDRDRRWVNGTIGVVEELSPTQIKVRIDDVVYEVSQETWEKIKYTYNRTTNKLELEVISSFKQYPIRPAWAITVHKSQGQTLKKMILDLSQDIFAAGQFYVAISRCEAMGTLYLTSPVKAQHIIVDPRIVEFMGRRSAIPVLESEK